MGSLQHPAETTDFRGALWVLEDFFVLSLYNHNYLIANSED